MFGMMWGFGGLTWPDHALSGLSLGMAVVLGLCTVFGTLIPPLVQGDFAAKLLDTMSGRIVLLGLGLTVLGIVVAMAGAAKDAAHRQRKRPPWREFTFRKGIMVAIFSGIMSACFAFGLAAGEPVKAIAAAHGAGALWTGLPILCMVMFGGLLTNAVWCADPDAAMVRLAMAGPGRGAPRRWRSTICWRPWRVAVVFPVLLLHHGREPDGRSAFRAGCCIWPASSSSARSGALR
jgi:hypothetical protein